MNKKYLNWVFVISWMILIFLFSHQPGDVSNENNKLVIYLFNLLGFDLDSMLGEFSDFIIRKLAHLTEYFILYLLIIRSMNYEKFKYENLYIALIYVFLYAASDEVHQAFIPNRGPAFKDVLIDTSGAIVALFAYYLCVKANHKAKVKP